MSDFKNPRPSVALQAQAAELAATMRLEGFRVASINLYDVGESLSLHAVSPVAGCEFDVEYSSGDSALFATYEDASDADGLGSFSVLGPAYRACDRAADCPASSDHADDCPVGLFV